MNLVENVKINFHPAEINQRIANLENNGFEEYLNTVDRGGDYDGFDHIIMTNTKKGHEFCDWVCDIYFFGKVAFLIYSKQF